MNEYDKIKAELAGKAMQVILPIRISQCSGSAVNICDLVAHESAGIAEAILKELNITAPTR